MFHYGKPRGRGTLSPKENPYFGPQFSLQASATTVSERPPKQASAPTGRDSAIMRNDSYTNGMPRKSSSSATDSLQDRNSGHSFQQHNSNSPHQHNNFLRTTTLGKRQVLPATAYAHDLSNPEPMQSVGNSSDSESRPGSGYSGQGSSRLPKAPVFLPGDRVIFAESPGHPGVPIVYRTPEERAANPDRLNLDRRRLTVCPILEGEEQLRLLNYQHNMISQIQHLSGLRRLIFLDLYDNQIDEISGLSALKSLRVLMLGKNRIRRIENLENLSKLDVLDLHGNQIQRIENLNHLSELRVLNLAGNGIEYVDNVLGMDALTELNLRRNKVRIVNDVDNLPNLQRLFLSFNEISSYDDIACLGDSSSLSEVSLDGNPLASEPAYKQTVLRHMSQLRQLDMKRVSEDERRIASVMARKEEEKKRESNKIAIMKEKRRLAISNARRQWEVMQGSMMIKSNKLSGTMPELVANHVGSVPNAELRMNEDHKDIESSRSSGRASRPASAKSIHSERELWPAGRPASTGASRSSSLTRGPTPKKKKVPTATLR